MADDKEKQRQMMADIMRGPLLGVAQRPDRMHLWMLEIPEGARDIFEYVAIDNHGGVIVVMKHPARVSLHIGGYGELFMDPLAVPKHTQVRLELRSLAPVELGPSTQVQSRDGDPVPTLVMVAGVAKMIGIEEIIDEANSAGVLRTVLMDKLRAELYRSGKITVDDEAIHSPDGFRCSSEPRMTVFVFDVDGAKFRLRFA